MDSRPSGARAREARPRVERSAGGVVFRRGGGGLNVLLIRDPYGQWGLPKGHIERGESTAAAALREVEEETGLRDLRLGEPLRTIDWHFRVAGRLVRKYCHFFLIEAPEGDPTPRLTEGITECRWASGADALEIVSYDNAREVVREALTRLRGEAG
jgi:8-oxo-dGTP pyrophosphatase MutT (NUDIX family)